MWKYTHLSVPTLMFYVVKRVQKGKPFLTASTLLKQDTKRIADTSECVTVHLGCQHIQMYVINSENANYLKKRLLSILLSGNSLRVVTWALQCCKFGQGLASSFYCFLSVTVVPAVLNLFLFPFHPIFCCQFVRFFISK